MLKKICVGISENIITNFMSKTYTTMAKVSFHIWEEKSIKREILVWMKKKKNWNGWCNTVSLFHHLCAYACTTHSHSEHFFSLWLATFNISGSEVHSSAIYCYVAIYSNKITVPGSHFRSSLCLIEDNILLSTTWWTYIMHLSS